MAGGDIFPAPGMVGMSALKLILQRQTKDNFLPRKYLISSAVILTIGLGDW